MESEEKKCCGNHNEDGECCGGHKEDGECCKNGSEDGGCCGGNNEEGGCGGGCGGCGGHKMLEGKNSGKTVRVHYKGTLDDGSQFDSSYDRGEPLEFVCGAGMMIAGFDKAVLEMEVGQIVDIHIEPAEAYGEYDERSVLKIGFEQMPGSEELNVGDRVYLSNEIGQQFLVCVTEKTDTEITFDANHELAGKALNFKIELVEIVE